MKKEVTICIMNGKSLPRGVYFLKKPNIWIPAIYFKKSKHITEKTFDVLIKYLQN